LHQIKALELIFEVNISLVQHLVRMAVLRYFFFQPGNEIIVLVKEFRIFLDLRARLVQVFKILLGVAEVLDERVIFGVVYSELNLGVRQL